MFGYADLLKEMQLFCRNGVETGIVGESECGRQIPYVFVGKKNGNYLVVQGAIHAREHLTALLVVTLAKHLVKNPDLFLCGGIYFVPMTNPDGVSLCQQGAECLPRTLREEALRINGGGDFSLWKANAKGVDLNVNFDARWGQGSSNVFEPSPANYVGEYPFCARETRALRDFTLKIKPCATVSYHLKGEEVYWEFGQTSHRRYRDKRYAQAIAHHLGYKTVGEGTSCGGYKDWCVQTLKIPAVTIEVGNDKFEHPFPYGQLETIYRQNEDVPRRFLNTVVRDKEKLAGAGLLDIFET